MLHIDEVIIVEGKYDKMQLERVCDATIFTTEGFRIFKDSEKRKFFTELSKKWTFLLWLIPLLGFFVSLAYLAGAAYNPFLYFRF